MKRKRRGSVLGKKASDILEIPQYLTSNKPHMTVDGDTELLLENYESITEYKQECLRIRTALGCLKIEGRGMSVQSMDRDAIRITGKICAILLQTEE